MYEGFILDRGDHNSKNLQKWVEGEPEKSFFLGIRTNDRDKYKVSTYRCDRCGYLESYAQTPSK
jgi:hypothetical protein